MDPVELAETQKIIEDAGGSAVSYLLDVSDKKQIESVLMQAIKDEKKIDKTLYSSGPYWNYKNSRTIIEIKKIIIVLKKPTFFAFLLEIL